MSAAFIECVGVGVQEFILSYNRHQPSNSEALGPIKVLHLISVANDLA